MQGIDKTMILSNKLDKKICLNSLLIMLSVTLAPKVIGILSIINTAGAFKQ